MKHSRATRTGKSQSETAGVMQQAVATRRRSGRPKPIEGQALTPCATAQGCQAVPRIEAVGAELSSTWIESSAAPWSKWPAAGVDEHGRLYTSHARIAQTLQGVLDVRQGETLCLTASANRRLWALVDTTLATEQWKVLDPVFWPFIGIVGWTVEHRDILQLAVWECVDVPWQIDDSWRQILTATAAVRATRRKHVA